MSELGENIVKAVTAEQRYVQKDRILKTWSKLFEYPPQNLPICYKEGYLPTGTDPVSISLKGGGELKFGLWRAFPSDKVNDLVMQVTCHDPKGELQTYPPFTPQVRYGFEWEKNGLGKRLTPNQSRAIDRFLAFFDPKKDIDLTNATAFTPVQRAILGDLRVEIPE